MNLTSELGIFMKFCKLFFVLVLIAVTSRNLNATTPGKIPSNFLGKWKAEFSFYNPNGSLLYVTTDKRKRTRFQVTGMVDKFYSDTGYYGQAIFYANGKYQSRYNSSYYIEGRGFFDAVYTNNGNWRIEGNYLKYNLSSSIYLTSTGEFYTGKFSYKTQIKKGKYLENYTFNSGYFASSIYTKGW